jgi:hypothetical protein
MGCSLRRSDGAPWLTTPQQACEASAECCTAVPSCSLRLDSLSPHQKLPRSWRAPSRPSSKQRSYQEDRLLGREAINKILQAGRGRSASSRKRSAPDPEPEQRDAVYADLRHTKRPCNTVDSIGLNAHVTQQPATPRSPAIDSVDSSRVAKS